MKIRGKIFLDGLFMCKGEQSMHQWEKSDLIQVKRT